jgi:hypothetical protein
MIMHEMSEGVFLSSHYETCDFAILHATIIKIDYIRTWYDTDQVEKLLVFYQNSMSMNLTELRITLRRNFVTEIVHFRAASVYPFANSAMFVYRQNA